MIRKIRIATTEKHLTREQLTEVLLMEWDLKVLEYKELNREFISLLLKYFALLDSLDKMYSLGAYADISDIPKDALFYHERVNTRRVEECLTFERGKFLDVSNPEQSFNIGRMLLDVPELEKYSMWELIELTHHSNKHVKGVAYNNIRGCQNIRNFIKRGSI